MVMNLGKSYGRDRHTVTTHGKRELNGLVLTAGHWRAVNKAPMQIVDQGRFAHFCDKQGLRLPRAFEQAVLTAREYSNYLVAASREFRQAFDAMLAGGGVKWATEWDNLVVNEGLDHLLDVTLSGGVQDTSWFVGLLAASPTALATWTATEIASNDFVDYDEATLQAWVDGGVAGQSVSNNASPAQFTISTNGSSIGGAYLIGTNAKGTPAGTLYAAGAFVSGNKAADDNDTLEVGSTFTAAAV